jgi:pilus assembly protein CpaD
MVMNRSLSSAALLMLALGTAACGPETNRLTPISNPSIYSVNQPVVEHTNYVFDVNYAPGGIPVYDQGRLAQWFQSLELGYGDRVYVQDGGISAAREDVARIAGDYGVLLSEGAPVTAGPVVAGGVRVIVTRAEASVPGCPIWEDQVVGAPEQTSTNFGCATNQNLARMIADPNDLVRGQDNGATTDSMAGTKAIRAWRDRQSSAGGANK